MPRPWSAIVGLTAVALALRLVGLDFGLPQRTHADEPGVVLMAVNAATGQWNPGFFVYPAAWSYLVSLVMRVQALLPPYGSVQAYFDVYCCKDPSPAWLLTRATTALAGTATVPLTWWLFRRAWGDRAALAAATFTAVGALGVRDAHFATLDTQAGLFTLLALAWASRLATGEGRGWRTAAALGVWCGLVAGMKYTAAIPLMPVVVLAAAWGSLSEARAWGRLVVWLGLIGAASVVTLLATNPYDVLEFDGLREAMAAEVERRRSYNVAEYPIPPWRYYAQVSLPFQLGVAGCVLALLGAWRALATRDRTGLLALLTVVGTLVAIVPLVNTAGRYLLPALPAASLLAGLGVETVWRWLGLRGLLAAALVGGAALEPGLRAARVAWLLTLPDTRQLSTAWIREHLPEGTAVALEWSYVPDVQPERYAVTPLVYDHEALKQAGVEVIVTSSYAYDRYYQVPDAYPHERAFLDEAHTWRELARFSGLPRERATDYVERVPPGPLDQAGAIGPDIRILEVP